MFPTNPSKRPARRLPLALDALVLASLLSSTAGALENQLDLVLVASRIVESARSSRGLHKKLRGSARSLILSGEMTLQAACAFRTPAGAEQIRANRRLPVTLSAH